LFASAESSYPTFEIDEHIYEKQKCCGVDIELPPFQGISTAPEEENDTT
jgi:hypothetical protein